MVALFYFRLFKVNIRTVVQQICQNNKFGRRALEGQGNMDVPQTILLDIAKSIRPSPGLDRVFAFRC